MSDLSNRRRRIRVLQSGKATSQFLSQVTYPVRPGLRFSFFRWPFGIFARFDIFHLHWPEAMLRDRNTIFRWVKTILMGLFIIRLRVQKIPVVRTVHNLAPHESQRPLERFFTRLLDQTTSVWVEMNGCTPMPEHGIVRRIPHAHYLEQFALFEAEPAVPGRLLIIGSLNPYKRVVELIRSFAVDPVPELELRIVGRPIPGYREEIELALQEADQCGANVSVRFEWVSPGDFYGELSAAELILLPYEEMFNSGVLLSALSVPRPVMASDSCVNREIQDEVGGDWLYLDSEPFSLANITNCLQLMRGSKPACRPQFAGRSFDEVANSYADVYLEALSRKPGIARLDPRILT